MASGLFLVKKKLRKSQRWHRKDHLPIPCWHLLTFGQPLTYLPRLVNVVCERPLSCISDFLERSLFLGNWTFSEFFGVHGNICRKLDFPPLKWPGARMSRRILSFKKELSNYILFQFVRLFDQGFWLFGQPVWLFSLILGQTLKIFSFSKIFLP